MAWKVNEPRTAQIAGHVVLSVFGGLGTLDSQGNTESFSLNPVADWDRGTLGGQLEVEEGDG